MSVGILSIEAMSIDWFADHLRNHDWQEFCPDDPCEQSRYFQNDEGSIEAWQRGTHVEATVRFTIVPDPDLFVADDEQEWDDIAERADA